MKFFVARYTKHVTTVVTEVGSRHVINRIQTLTRHNMEKQEMQQIMELLLTMQEQMRANHEDLMAKLDAWGSDSYEETLACQEMETRKEAEPTSVDRTPEAPE